MTIKDPIYN